MVLLIYVYIWLIVVVVVEVVEDALRVLMIFVSRLLTRGMNLLAIYVLLSIVFYAR